VFSSSCYDLLDGTLEEADQLKIIRELVNNFERYDMLYGVRSRRSGNRAFIDIFIGFDPDKRVGDVERECEVIRKSVAAQFPNSFVTVVIGAQDAVPVPAALAQSAPGYHGGGDDAGAAASALPDAGPVRAESAPG
jgi:divalent metal cation (Fe/Co/Zn/Cd) transporter